MLVHQVGVTAAIAADLVLEGMLDGHPGVATPMLPEVYEPGLVKLEAEGFTFRERAAALPPATAADTFVA